MWADATAKEMWSPTSRHRMQKEGSQKLETEPEMTGEMRAYEGLNKSRETSELCT